MSLFLLGVLWLSGASVMAQGLPLMSQVIHTVHLGTGASSLSDAFWVTETSSMLVRVTVPQDNCQLTLTPPNAPGITWDPASSLVSCGQLPVQPDPSAPPIGYIYSFSVAGPVNGKWSLQVTTPTPLTADWNSVVDVDFASPLGMGLFPSESRISMGKSVSISLGAMDGFTPLTGYQCTAFMIREGSPLSSAQTVTFNPVTDAETGTVTPVAVVTPTLPGTYFISVVLTGATPAGTYERSAATMFQAFAPPATIGGPLTERVELSFPSLQE